MSGALASFSAADLGGIAIAEALSRAGVAPDEVDHVIMGQVLMAGQGQVPSRQAASKAGIPMSVPAVNVNKVCLSGLNCDLPRPSDGRDGRRRHRRRRRHGVDDQCSLPRRRRARRLPLRQHRAPRRDHRRRPVVLVRLVSDGPRHRALRRGHRDHPRAAGRDRRRVEPAGGSGDRGGQVRRRDRHRVGPAAQGRPDPGRARRGRACQHDDGDPRRHAPRVRQGGHDHRRERVAAVRRRLGRHRDVEGGGRASAA